MDKNTEPQGGASGIGSQSGDASPSSDRVLHNFVGTDFDFRLETRKNCYEIVVSLLPKGKGVTVTPNSFEALLARLGVTGKPLTKNLKEVCDLAGEGKSVKYLPIFEGLAPVPGEDERLHFLVGRKKGAGESDNEELPGDRLINVENGERIAVLHPPTPGTPGCDVFGVPIPSKPGVSLDPRPAAGDNVRIVEDGRVFEATISGRVLYNREKRVVMVSDLYVIDGNVGVDTGDITFVGSVEVRHDVAKGFSIKAGKNITIFGNVEACRLEAGVDIEIRGGMFGQNIGRIICRGNLKAKYLDNLHVECVKNLYVKNEIVNSTVHCDGAIYSPTGKIIGGECICRSGIEFLEIGSDAGIRTEIVVGVSFFGVRRLREIAEQKDRLDKRINKLNQYLAPFLERMEAGGDLSSMQKIQVKEWAEELKESNAKQDELEATAKDVLRSSLENANPLINVKRAIHPNAVLTFGKNAKTVTEAIARPASVIFDTGSGDLYAGNLRPLSTPAHKIQEELDRERERRKAKT